MSEREHPLKKPEAGHDGPRGPPRAGIGAQGAAQNPIIANLGEASPTDGPDGGSASPGPSFAASNPPSNEKYSLFLSGIPPSLDDRWLHEILEVSCSVCLVS